jgi:predicted ArsR family transcriptional regulator
VGGDLLSVSSRRKVLEELKKSGEANSYALAKKLGVPDSAVGKHLKILQEAGLVEEPTVDVSEGRLRKVYRPAKDAEKILGEFWVKEVRSAPESIQKILKGEQTQKEGNN